MEEDVKKEESTKVEIKAYDGTLLYFYPKPHWYKIAGEKTYLMSPSSITGVLDKSDQLMKWQEKIVYNALLTRGMSKERSAEIVSAVNEAYEKYVGKKDKDTYIKVARRVHASIAIEIQAPLNQQDLLDFMDTTLMLRHEKLEEAATIGDHVHAYAEAVAYHRVYNPDSFPPRDVDMPEQAWNGCNAVQTLVNRHNMKFIDVERFVFSNKQFKPYAGKFDAIVEIDGVPTLIDFKTSKGVYSSQKYQLGGYDIAMQEESRNTGKPLPYTQIAIIHIDKNTGEPSVHILSPEEREQAHIGFLGALMLKSAEKILNKPIKK